MNRCTAVKTVATVWTQNQPISGMRTWKTANTPAIRHMLRRGISGERRPLAMETEKASIARPTPKRILLKKNPVDQFTSDPPKKG
jgi:hypothetical protein